jgi:hypothetical protein
VDFFTQWSFPAENVRSLCWLDDTLIDWVDGGKVYQLDGKFHFGRYGYAYRFDAAKVSPSGSFAVIYENYGTKGIIVDREGEILRQINRDFYHADDYTYPIALFCLPDGREAIVHCPNSYCQLEIEDILTGDKLTYDSQRQTVDIFFSRLAVHSNGQYLLNNGWVWSPWDILSIYDISQVLTNPSLLDDWKGIAPQTAAEICNAVFGIDLSVLLVTSEETNSEEEDGEEEERLADPLWYSGAHSLAVYDLQTQQYRSIVRIEDNTETIGDLMPISERYVVAFYDYPKLIDLTTGKIVWCWSKIALGKPLSNVGVTNKYCNRPIAKIAIDINNSRFAVASESEIAIVQINPNLLPSST